VTLQMNEQAVHVPLGTEDTLRGGRVDRAGWCDYRCVVGALIDAPLSPVVERINFGDRANES
jgi:hypothetical protein